MPGCRDGLVTPRGDEFDESFSDFLHLTSQTRAPAGAEWRGSDARSRLATRSVPRGRAAARLAGDVQGVFRPRRWTNPRTARLSHARVYDMLMAGGSETLPNGDKKHNFFAEELFGIERPLQHLVDYFASAARRLEVRKRILLLMGPVGGGKSTIVTMLKRGPRRVQPGRGRRRLRHRRLPDARGAAPPPAGEHPQGGARAARPLHRGRSLPALPDWSWTRSTAAGSRTSRSAGSPSRRRSGSASGRSRRPIRSRRTSAS